MGKAEIAPQAHSAGAPLPSQQGLRRRGGWEFKAKLQRHLLPFSGGEKVDSLGGETGREEVKPLRECP